MRVIGAIIIIIGFALLIGNVSGCMRSFPFAGFLVMSVGGLISKAGDE